MPNKTIYVSDDCLPLLRRAQELVGGNLSGAIVTALRRLVEFEDSRQEGFDEVVVRVGTSGERRMRFTGRLLGRWAGTTEGMFESYRVYLGRTGKFAVHRQAAELPPTEDGGRWPVELRSWRGLVGMVDPDWGGCTLTVVETLDALREHVPPQVYRLVVDTLEHPQIETVDI